MRFTCHHHLPLFWEWIRSLKVYLRCVLKNIFFSRWVLVLWLPSAVFLLNPFITFLISSPSDNFFHLLVSSTPFFLFFLKETDVEDFMTACESMANVCNAFSAATGRFWRKIPFKEQRFWTKEDRKKSGNIIVVLVDPAFHQKWKGERKPLFATSFTLTLHKHTKYDPTQNTRLKEMHI